MLTCKKIIQKFLSQASTGLRAQGCCSSSHSCVPWLSAWRHAAVWLSLSRSGLTGHQWQESLSCWREAVLSLSHATLLVMYSPICHTLCLFVLSDCPLFPSALFSTVQQLWLCVFGFTIQEKRALYHLCSWRLGLCDQTTQTTEFGSKVILFPLRDYC